MHASTQAYASVCTWPSEDNSQQSLPSCHFPLVLGFELGSSGLTESTFSHSTVLLAQLLFGLRWISFACVQYFPLGCGVSPVSFLDIFFSILLYLSITILDLLA